MLKAFIWLSVTLPLQILGFINYILWAALQGVIGGIAEHFPKGGNTYSKGKAAFAGERELKKSGHIGGTGFRLGFLKDKPIHATPEASVIAFAPKGYGKSLAMGASIRQEIGAHMIVIDASGSIYERHKAELTAKGYAVRVVNLVKPDKGITYDPMSVFKHSKSEFDYFRMVSTLAQLAVQDDGHTTNEHFTDNGRRMLAGALTAEGNMINQLETLPAIAEAFTGLTESELNKYLDAIATLNDPRIKSAVKTYQSVSKNERGSFISTIGRKFEPFLDPAVKYLAKGRKWCWEDVFSSQKPIAVFLITGISHKEIVAPYTRLFVGLAVASASRWFDNHGMIPNGLKIYVDEADLLGNCQPIAEAITKQRKIGVTTWLSYQSESQLIKGFGRDEAQTIISNCDIWVTGGLNDGPFLEKIARLMGATTQLSDIGNMKREESIPLMSSDQIRAMSINKCLALMGTRQVLLDKSYKLKDGVRFK